MVGQNTEKQRLEAMRSQLSIERNKWKVEWHDLSANIAPDNGVFTFSEDNANRGGPDRSKIMDGYPGRVARDFAAGMQSVATPKSRPWFRTGVYDTDMMEYGPVKEHLKLLDDTLRFIFAQSNLYTALPSVYLELGVFGTGNMGVFDSFDSVLRFRSFTIGEYMLSRNHEGITDTFVREYHMTARQMIQHFGLNNVSAKVKRAADSNGKEQWFDVVHAVTPNQDYDQNNPFDKRFKSCYYEPQTDVKNFLLQSGFEYFPFLTPASNRIGTRVYGTGPGSVALPDVKSLYKLKEKTFLAVDKAVDPPLVGPGTMKDEVINSMPGGMSYDTESAVAGSGLRPLHETRPDLSAAREMINDLREQIGAAFYHDLFLMMAMTDRREITATEVAERHEEKLLMLAPLSESVHSELLDPLIDIAVAKVYEHELIPPPPEELQGQQLKIEYIDMLTQAQKMVGITANEQLAGFVGNLVGVFPEVRHKFNVFEAVDDYASRLGTVPSIIRTDDEANELAAEERKQIQQQKQMEQAAGAAQTAKVMSETDVTGGNSALDAVIGGLQ